MMYSQIRHMPSPARTMLATSQRALFISVVMMVLSYAVLVQAIAVSENLTLRQGPPVGGDFVAFWGAARAALSGLAADIYRPEAYEAFLMEHTMPRERFGLTWQYPPTYYFLILPLAALPFLPGYVLWSGGSLVLFLVTLRRTLKLDWTGLLLIASLPVCFNAIITGQNGFLTATLLLAATMQADRRPLLAGLCAGLLTVKPQLGILLPFAFAAAGCWRAFFAAAVTAAVMAAASFGVFGVEAWQAFLAAVLGVSDGVSKAVYPLHKMPTVFAALARSGVPGSIAMAAQGLAALGAIGLVAWCWRRLKDIELRAAILCAAVFLCTPYAYYYEMTILVFPAVVLVRQALKSGFLSYEEISLIVLWMIPVFLPGMAKYCGQLWLACVLILLALLVRRAWPDLTGIRSASAMSPAPAY